MTTRSRSLYLVDRIWYDMRVIFFSSWLRQVEMLSSGILDMPIRISPFRRFEVSLVGRLQVSLTSFLSGRRSRCSLR
jgi:hypothetical protein